MKALLLGVVLAASPLTLHSDSIMGRPVAGVVAVQPAGVAGVPALPPLPLHGQHGPHKRGAL